MIEEYKRKLPTFFKPTKTVNVLSLGAGVQSSALLLKYDDILDFAVFADTGDEPQEVYKWLDYLDSITKTEIIRVMHKDGSLGSQIDRSKFTKVPVFALIDGKIINSLGERQCTFEYKVDIVDKAIKKRIGYGEKYARIKTHKVNVYIGISSDEISRVRSPRE